METICYNCRRALSGEDTTAACPFCGWNGERLRTEEVAAPTGPAGEKTDPTPIRTFLVTFSVLWLINAVIGFGVVLAHGLVWDGLLYAFGSGTVSVLLFGVAAIIDRLDTHQRNPS